jgi:hypothetical protein
MNIIQGTLYKLNSPLTSANSKFTYEDILARSITYALENVSASKDEIQFKVFDGVFETAGRLVIKKLSSRVNMPVMEKNEALNAIAGKLHTLR